MNQKQSNLTTSKFIVTGCSRSGTGYISKLLSEIGYKCGHESIFNFDYLSQITEQTNYFDDFPEFDGDSSSGAAPFIDGLPVNTLILHQLRHPAHCIRSHMGIRSFANHHQPSGYLADDHVAQVEFFDQRFCPEIFQTPDELSRCMRYWVLWNKLSEKAEKADGLRYFRYRIEDMDLNLLRKIISLIGGQGTSLTNNQLNEALASVSRSTNSRLRDESIQWETLPESQEKQAVERLATDYGYTLP